MRAITEHTGVPASNQRLVIGSRELDLAGRVDGDRGTEVTLVQGAPQDFRILDRGSVRGSVGGNVWGSVRGSVRSGVWSRLVY